MSFETKFIDKSSYGRIPDEWNGVIGEVRSISSSLSNYYPSFNIWFDKKVVPGLLGGERTLIAEYRKGTLAGFAIVKDDGIEKKLSCLRVMPPFESSGMGVRLFERSFDVLGTSTPLLSVAEENLKKFDRIFNYFGFELIEKYKDLYRDGALEYSFNGALVTYSTPASIDSRSSSLLHY